EQNPAIRFRVPLPGTTKFEDAVFGSREVSNEEIEDFVLLRSPKPGSELPLPTYQLAAVVDDIEMRITHVIRGADHLSNTPKQSLLYRALNQDRKSTRLNSSHGSISYAVFCLKKKRKTQYSDATTHK